VLLARGRVQLELLVERLLDPSLCADERLALYSVILAFENIFASKSDLSNETRYRILLARNSPQLSCELLALARGHRDVFLELGLIPFRECYT
jgi:hypothetical protein